MPFSNSKHHARWILLLHFFLIRFFFHGFLNKEYYCPLGFELYVYLAFSIKNSSEPVAERHCRVAQSLSVWWQLLSAIPSVISRRHLLIISGAGSNYWFDEIVRLTTAVIGSLRQFIPEHSAIFSRELWLADYTVFFSAPISVYAYK